jgi:hypothetical protein
VESRRVAAASLEYAAAVAGTDVEVDALVRSAEILDEELVEAAELSVVYQVHVTNPF